MIKSWEELGDVLAEFENRLSALEMSSRTYPIEEEPKLDKLPDPEWNGKQWDAVHQLQSEVRGWREKRAEILLALDKLNKKIKLYEGGDLT